MYLRVTLAESASCAIIVAALAAVLAPGLAGWQGARNDRQTQHDLARVAATVARLHQTAVSTGGDVTNISVESATAARIRVFPAKGPAELIDVADGTELSGQNGLVHYGNGAWCLAFTNPRGKTKTYHSHSNRGLSRGGCPRG